MIRGTTPTHTYTLPFETALIADVRILYAQNGAVLVAKTTGDCTMQDSQITVTLTERETLRLSQGSRVQIQLRVKTISGAVLSTPVMHVPIGACLDNEVMT